MLRRVFVSDPDHGYLPALLLLLTLLSGVVDAVSILRLGRVFVANMTGNLVFTGFAIGGASGFSIAVILVALAGFVVGVLGCRFAAGSRVIVLRNGAGVEVVLIGVAAVISGIVGPHADTGARYTMVALCAIALGVQNGLVRRLGIPEMTTTVVTRTLVSFIGDIGVHGREPAALRQGFSVVVLIAGAAAGAGLLSVVDPAVPLGLAAVLALATAAGAALYRGGR